MASFDKRHRHKEPPRGQREFAVYVVIRHTKMGDKLENMFERRETAMQVAEDIADQTAHDYGRGSTSVFKATLTLEGEAMKP